MARLNRAELFGSSEVAVVHVMSRVVRRCYLMGQDPVSGKCFDHRRVWIEELLERWAKCFGIDLIAFSLMSNHMHLVLRSRPDVVKSWHDTEVARRWLMLCPVRKNGDGSPKEPSEPELDAIRSDEDKLREIRSRLSDISWWMRLLNQRIAKRANVEDERTGHFWESRFKAVRLLDEAAILACAAYVDLNPVRAEIAETIESSEFTSIQRRVQALRARETLHSDGHSHNDASRAKLVDRDDCLAPVDTGEGDKGNIGPQLNRRMARCSDKGFASLAEKEYVQLLDWTARQAVPGKRGSTPINAPNILERLGIPPDSWCSLVSSFETLFSLVAGQPNCIAAHRSRLSKTRFHIPAKAREILTN